MNRYLISILTLFFVNVCSRNIPYSDEEHTNRSICEGQLLTKACKTECLSQNIHPLCTLDDAHLCVCEYPPGLHGDAMNEDRIAVMIKLAHWDPDDPVVSSESDETVEKLNQKSNSEKQKLKSSSMGSHSPPLSASVIPNYFTESEELLNDKPVHARSRNHPPTPPRKAWTEPMLKVDVTYKNSAEQLSGEHNFKVLPEELVGTGILGPFTNHGSKLQWDKKDELYDEGYTVNDGNVSIKPVDENTLELTSANPFYEKYFIVDAKFRSIVTSQTFVLSAILVYLTLGIICFLICSYKRTKPIGYTRLPFINCNKN